MEEKFEYRGIKYMITSDTAFKFKLKILPESKHFQYMSHDDMFLCEDAGHYENEGQTDEERIQYLHRIAKEQIDILLSETIADKQQSIYKIQNEVKQLQKHAERYPSISIKNK